MSNSETSQTSSKDHPSEETSTANSGRTLTERLGSDYPQVAKELVTPVVYQNIRETIEGLSEDDPDYKILVQAVLAYGEDLNVYVVWFNYTLGNWKALVSTNIPDNLYYEVTYDKSRDLYFIDQYHKVNQVTVNGARSTEGE